MAQVRQRPAPKPVSDKALREALRRQAQPLRTLPARWWDPGVAEWMAEFIRLRKAGLV